MEVQTRFHMDEEIETDKISKYISDMISGYLGFDVNELFKISDYAYIFGGAIRDSIVNDKINDVDILCLRHSRKNIVNFLIKDGWVRLDLHKPDIHSLYSDIRVIFEPHTYVKGDRIIQLITPSNEDKTGMVNEFKNFFHVLTNVDISCCGIYYDGFVLRESYPAALTHILSKVFKVDKSNSMYNPDRIQRRVFKLESKGWENINDISSDEIYERGQSEFKRLIRDIKIEELL